MEQRISFVRTRDDTNIAYALSGEGPPIVRAGTWLTHIHFDWDSPVWGHWFRLMSQAHTLIRYDPRGFGLSQAQDVVVNFDNWVQDLEAVVDKLQLETFPLFGMSGGGSIAIEYCLRHPERVSKLILYAPHVTGWRNARTREAERWNNMQELVEAGWGEENLAFPAMFAHLFLPDGPPETVKWYADLQRKSASKEVARQFMEMLSRVRLFRKLKNIQVPTVIIQVSDDQVIFSKDLPEVAAEIPGCEFEIVESRNHILMEDEPGWKQFEEIFARHVQTAQATKLAPTDTDLSARELQILAEMVKGASNDEIAEALFISEKTVRNHITHIFSKLNVTTRAKAIVLGQALLK